MSQVLCLKVQRNKGITSAKTVMFEKKWVGDKEEDYNIKMGCLYSFFVSLHTTFIALPITPFFPHFLVLISSWISFSICFPLFSLFLSHCHKSHAGFCGEVLLWAAMGSASCSSLLTLVSLPVGKSSTWSVRWIEQAAYMHFLRWASDSSVRSEPTEWDTGILNCLWTPFYLVQRLEQEQEEEQELTWSVRLVKQSALHLEWLRFIWTFSRWIFGVIPAFLLSG